MAENHIELTDEVLGAYVDDELDPATRSRVERSLSVDRDARSRLAAIRDITMLVRVATRGGTGVRVDGAAHGPEVIDLSSRIGVTAPAAARGRRAPAWLDWRMAASFVAGLAVMLGALELGQLGGSEAPTWQRSALEFHHRYARAASTGGDLALDHLSPASSSFARDFARIADYEPVLPDLSGQNYAPIGARLLPTFEGVVTHVVYEAPGRPAIGYSMVLTDRRPRGEDFITMQRDGVRMVVWGDDRYEYGISGALSYDALEILAETARHSVRTTARAQVL